MRKFPYSTLITILIGAAAFVFLLTRPPIPHKPPPTATVTQKSGDVECWYKYPNMAWTQYPCGTEP